MARNGKQTSRSQNGKRGGGRRPNFKKDADREDFKSNQYTHNDISWYTPDLQILNDAGRLPYSIPTGMPISRPYTNQGTSGTDFAIPGILVQKIMPTLGYAADPSDPVNVAAQGVYSFVRHLNSGSRNYDPVDLMIYIGALDSVYSCISWATRIYATICSYTQGNRYLPRVLMKAQGVDFDDIADNMVQFRAKLNQRIAKASQLMVPNIMPIFERHRWLFANYYIEGDDMKDQIYLYAPIGFYKFQLDSDDAGMLKAVRLGGIRTELKADDIIQLLDDMLNPIIEDEDFNIMSGDIYKAYNGNIVTYSMIPDMIAMNFTFDENVLLQFKNSKSLPVAESTTGWDNNHFDYVQDSTKRYLTMTISSSGIKGYMDPFLGFTKYSGSMAAPEAARVLSTMRAWSKPIMLTSPHRNVEAAENMISTRGTTACEMTISSTAGNSNFKNIYFGSEWYERFEIWTNIRFRSSGTITHYHQDLSYTISLGLDLDSSSTTASWVETFMGELFTGIEALAKFKYHPEVFLLFNGQKGGTAMSLDNTAQSLFEVDNYSVVDANVIKGLHDAALLGEYNVPRIALLPT